LKAITPVCFYCRGGKNEWSRVMKDALDESNRRKDLLKGETYLSMLYVKKMIFTEDPVTRAK